MQPLRVIPLWFSPFEELHLVKQKLNPLKPYVHDDYLKYLKLNELFYFFKL